MGARSASSARGRTLWVDSTAKQGKIKGGGDGSGGHAVRCNERNSLSSEFGRSHPPSGAGTEGGQGQVHRCHAHGEGGGDSSRQGGVARTLRQCFTTIWRTTTTPEWCGTHAVHQCVCTFAGFRGFSVCFPVRLSARRRGCVRPFETRGVSPFPG